MRSRRFERMVVGLPQGMNNRPAIEAAADLAEFLRLELLATFVADATLLDLAAMPAVRELRILERQWQPIDLAQISRDLEHAADIARRRFGESVGSRSIKTRFDVIAGAQVMASLIRGDDIVAILEPAYPGERITRQFTSLLDAAFETAAAILVVPRRVVRTSGPILALAENPDDASIAAALEIAAALNERLIVAIRAGAALPPQLLADAEQLGVAVEQIAFSGPVAGALALLPSAKERLRVVMRSGLPDDAHQLFSTLHGVPLLVIEPERAEAGPGRE